MGLLCSSNICFYFHLDYCWNNIVCQYQRRYSTFCLSDNKCRMDLGLRCQNYTCACSLCTTCFRDGIRCCDCPTA
jgi:hypothetical protein